MLTGLFVVYFAEGTLANVRAHFVAFALELHTSALDQVGYCGDGFALAASATAHQFDEFAQGVNRPLDFVWDFFHNNGWFFP